MALPGQLAVQGTEVGRAVCSPGGVGMVLCWEAGAGYQALRWIPMEKDVMDQPVSSRHGGAGAGRGPGWHCPKGRRSPVQEDARGGRRSGAFLPPRLSRAS